MAIRHYVIQRANGYLAEIRCNGDTEPPMLMETGAWKREVYSRPHETDKIVLYYIKGLNEKFVDQCARQVWNTRRDHDKHVTFGLFTSIKATAAK